MRVLFISHVLPFPGESGQQLRVRHTVEAATRRFAVDFLTCAPKEHHTSIRHQLTALGCRPIIIEAKVGRGRLVRLWQELAARAFVLRTGLKRSNFLIGQLDLAAGRIRAAIRPQDYDLVVYEYFHAVDSVPLFQECGVPSVLDMHNVLWRSHEQRLGERSISPAWLKRSFLNRYRQREESAWDQFDALIAINRNEYELVQARRRTGQKLFYAPMGTDLQRWPHCWRPAHPPRLGYYGGLASAHNETAALFCHDRIMPQVWQRFPEAELWLVGSNPSPRLRLLTRDPRVKVTGFVEHVQDLLAQMSLVLCPWSGAYGFRSRIVETMALGVPVVATAAAVDGMELKSGQGIMLVSDESDLPRTTVELLADAKAMAIQSERARSEMERLYSLEKTYGRLTDELQEWVKFKSDKLAPTRPPIQPEQTVLK